MASKKGVRMDTLERVVKWWGMALPTFANFFGHQH
jgi:hypothetical protein